MISFYVDQNALVEVLNILTESGEVSDVFVAKEGKRILVMYKQAQTETCTNV